ncbi:imidazole glycerol phosphate synthase subunit HisH [Altererythrobacter aurantiacus]|uniref:Imidazole glycerol phosphate synthase subunit HisH n=1 Tax=Parapontixanthobacter aurantiacus TaxID=1463599 RepID=A0A844ZJT3_9SPHN|nr:imidazole glycerol phosphate synthase subunit HisH [Parapontixanthobacter aurantiacus]
MAETVALIDYGAGNLHSVHNALQAVGAQVVVTDRPEDVARANRLVLPGVGSFKACMDGLTAIPDMAETLREAVLERRRPFLGICVGMQLMARFGLEHGRHDGLGWVEGTVAPLKPSREVKVPHMGWNMVEPTGPASLVERGEAYFLHSYAFEPGDDDLSPVCAVTTHGGRVTAAIQKDTALGVQFHPEKSQKYGLDLLTRFLAWKP